MNNVKVFVLMAGLTALFGTIGGAVGGQSGMVIALLFAGVMNFVMYWVSSSMVLRMYDGAMSLRRSRRPPKLDQDARGATSAADVFMLRGLVYEALSGGRQLPPASAWPEQHVHERAEHSLRRDTGDPRIGAVSGLLRRMLVRSPEWRLPAREVVRACQAIRTGRTTVG